jgi:nitric oxide dioxygenase
MTPEQLELIGTTVADVQDHAQSFSACFYERLFDLAPDTRAMFPDDLAEHRRKLVEELSFLAEGVSDLPSFVERARDLGARHHHYGVRPRHYDVVEQALLAALADALGPVWNPTTTLAWQRLYRLMAETMLEGSAGASFVDPDSVTSPSFPADSVNE